jgi:replicative DNA helicase
MNNSVAVIHSLKLLKVFTRRLNVQTTGEKILAHLAAYELKQHGDEWRCNSPLRAGANSHSFTVRIDADGEHGAWSDHAGGEGGSLYDLAERLKIPVESTHTARTAIPDSNKPYHTLSEYAAFKGVPVEAFQKAGWTEPIPYDKRLAFQFPTAGNQLRYRFTDGKKPKFKSQTGYKACWYGLKIAVTIAKANNMPIVLCNGEPSVIVAMHYKVPACAITGGEQPTIPAPLLDELKATWQGSIIIALDCDEAGRKAAAGKERILKAAGFVVKVVDLGLGDKGDLADTCKLHTVDSMSHLLKLSEQPEPVNSTTADGLPTLLKDLIVVRKMGEKTSITLPKLLDQIQHEIDLSRLDAHPQAIQSFSALVSTRHKRLDDARKTPSAIQGLRSGMDKLDELIGGFVPGRIYTIYGDTGMGKSTIAASIVASFAGQAAGFIIPTESMPGDYLDKLVAYKANVPFDAIETGQINDEQYRTIMAAYGWLEEKNCHFLDSLSPTSTMIGTAIRDGIQKFNYQWVLIDSINNLTSVMHDDIYGKTSEAADFAQELARMGLVVIITSQIGRNMKGRKVKIPKLNDAMGSGKVEQNSDVVLAVYNHQYYVDEESAKPDDRFPNGLILAKCLKHRWRGSARGKSRFLTFKGGIGVYD